LPIARTPRVFSVLKAHIEISASEQRSFSDSSLLAKAEARVSSRKVARGSNTRLTCAGHGHDQLLVKRETATRGQTGAQIHSQHAVLLLVPLQVLRILRPCGDGRTDRAAWRGEVKEQENEKEYEPLQFPRLVSPALLVLRTCFS